MSDDDKMDALLRRMAAEEYNRPPQIVPRASIRRSAHSTSRQGTARFSRASRSRNTTP